MRLEVSNRKGTGVWDRHSRALSKHISPLAICLIGRYWTGTARCPTDLEGSGRNDADAERAGRGGGAAVRVHTGQQLTCKGRSEQSPQSYPQVHFSPRSIRRLSGPPQVPSSCVFPHALLPVQPNPPERPNHSSVTFEGLTIASFSSPLRPTSRINITLTDTTGRS